jgi:hypothetical protein
MAALFDCSLAEAFSFDSLCRCYNSVPVVNRVKLFSTGDRLYKKDTEENGRSNQIHNHLPLLRSHDQY